MRKIVALVLSLSLLLAMQISTFAAQSNETAFTEEISEMESVEWIQDNGTLISSEIKTASADQQEELSFKVDTYNVVTQENYVSLLNGNFESTEYSNTTYQLWSVLPQGNGSSEYGDHDITYSVYFRLTINYTDTVYNGYTYRRMTTVSGQYSIEDTQMDVITHSYELGESGGTYPNNTFYEYAAEYPLSIPLYSWTRTISSSSFPAIRTANTEAVQGGKYHYTIIRSGSGTTWSGYIPVSTLGTVS